MSWNMVVQQLRGQLRFTSVENMGIGHLKLIKFRKASSMNFYEIGVDKGTNVVEFRSIPEFWEEANGEGMLNLYPILDCLFLLLLFCTNQTAITIRLRARNPTMIPTATAPPVLSPPVLRDVELAFASVPLVDLAVGFSVGTGGKGVPVGLPAVGELSGGDGGELAGVEDEGTKGGEGGEGAGVEGDVDGAPVVGTGGGGGEFADDLGGDEGLEEGGDGTIDGGGGEGETDLVGGGGD